MIANNLNSDSNSTYSDGLSTTVSPAISPKNEARGSPECHVSPTRSMSQWDSSCLMRSRSKSWTTSPITRRRPSAARSSSSGLSIDRFGYFATDCRNENTLKDPDTELEASTLPFISDDNRQDSAHSRTSVQSVSCPPVNFLQDFKTTRSFPPRNHVGGNDPIWFRRKFNFTPDQPTPRLQHMSARKKNLTVLIADDNSINIAIFERKLKKLGHDTMTTCDGNQAFEAFQKHKEKVDFILMDLNMPFVDGIQATVLIRGMELTNAPFGKEAARMKILPPPEDVSPSAESPSFELSSNVEKTNAENYFSLARHYPRVPIFACSDALRQYTRETLENAGFDGWLSKPVEFKRLGLCLEGATKPEMRNKARCCGDYKIGGWFR